MTNAFSLSRSLIIRYPFVIDIMILNNTTTPTSKLSSVGFISAGIGKILIVTGNTYLQSGLTELAMNYFVTPNKTLCILDSGTFGNVLRLYSYLIYLTTLKKDINIIVINESICGNTKKGDICPWVLGRDTNIKTLKSIIVRASNAYSNIKEIIDFYSVRMNVSMLNVTQSIIIDYLRKGLTVNAVAHILEVPPKTIYTRLRKIRIAYNQPSLNHLLHFLGKNDSLLSYCKHPLADHLQSRT